MSLGNVLLEKGLLTPAQFDEALRRQRLAGGSLAETVVALGLLRREALQAVLEEPPLAPDTVDATGLDPQFLLSFVLRALYVLGLETIPALSDALKLPTSVLTEIFDLAKRPRSLAGGGWYPNPTQGEGKAFYLPGRPLDRGDCFDLDLERSGREPRDLDGRAGRRSDRRRTRAYTSFMPGKSSKYGGGTPSSSRGGRPHTAASRIATTFLSACSVCSSIDRPTTSPAPGVIHLPGDEHEVADAYGLRVGRPLERRRGVLRPNHGSISHAPPPFSATRLLERYPEGLEDRVEHVLRGLALDQPHVEG